MTTVEYYKHVPIVCDEIIPDSVRRDCKNHDFYILVPFLSYQHLNICPCRYGIERKKCNMSIE